MKKQIAVLVCAVAMVASPAFAGYSNFSSASGLNLTIPDNGYNGTLASMASHSIVVPAQPPSANMIDDLNVTIAMRHTWVGDLTIKLGAPNGTIITLLNRPGLVTPDNGTGCCGRSDNFLISLPITYDDSAAISAEVMGTGTSTNNIGDGAVGTADGNIFASAPDGSSHPGNLTSLNGINPSGAWTLYIGDSESADTGALDSWSLSISAVPEPATIGLLAIGALGLIRRRR